MNARQPRVLPHLRSLRALTSHISASRLGVLDAREWEEDWGERWVAFADLIAFASRAMQSDSVVLNNIVRFDRAAQTIAEAFPSLPMLSETPIYPEFSVRG